MTEKIIEILTNYFGWQRKESINKSASEIESLIKENYVEKGFVEWLKENCDTLNVSESINPKWVWEIRDRVLGYDSKHLYQYWFTNIKDK
jgi:hypothetical protein